MSRKIIGVTVGTQLPKPNFTQHDPTKGDYIKNKPKTTNEVTENSEDLITSGGVFAAISEMVGDINSILDYINGEVI